MTKDEFYTLLNTEIKDYNKLLETTDGEWIVKGFIDIYKNIYPITSDTKVISKLVEIILIPHLANFATKHGLQLELPNTQISYPDLTFIDSENHLFAVDFKTTYRDKKDNITGMTLGAFSGYFRDRSSTKNIQHPYEEYETHLVLGTIYQKTDDKFCDIRPYELNELENIVSVIKNFKFFLQPKYKIASDIPGSGNTKNIGSVTDFEKLMTRNGIFANLGEDVFDDYWMNYLTLKDAREQGIVQPYNNLETYKKYLETKSNLAAKLKNEK